MGGAFDWLSSFIETFSKVFPRIIHVLETHQAVCFRRGKHSKLLPGIHWYWPVWSIVVSQPVKRQTINLWMQTLMTKDGETVIASETVVYEISDVEKALVETYDLIDTINDLAQVSVKEIIQSMTLLEIQAEPGEVDKRLTRSVRSELHPFGIKVIRAFMDNLSTATVLRNVQEQASVAHSPSK